jgi:hypothetical protein
LVVNVVFILIFKLEKVMTNFLKFLVLGSAMLAASGFTCAADIEDNVVKRLTAEEQRGFFVAGHEIKVPNVDVSAKVKRAADGTFLAPAQGISYYQIFAIISTKYPKGEYPAAGLTQTTEDHGGEQLFVYVLQYGYGNPNQAIMNGVARSAGNSRTICGPSTSIHFCGVGETVTGWLYAFDFSGQQSGNFTTGANSVASPFGYWSDSIYIK